MNTPRRGTASSGSAGANVRRPVAVKRGVISDGPGRRGTWDARTRPSSSSSSSYTTVPAGDDITTSFSSMLLFLYGIVGGALACLFFFFFIFYKVRAVLNHTIRKKAIKHQAFEEVAKAAAVVPAAKVETLCKVVCFDDGVVGEVIQCRALLYSDTMVLYKVEELVTHQDHRQVVTRETLLGKINRNCAVTTGERISKYHRHLNLFSRYSPVKGKVTILRSKDDGIPLFMEDPAARLQERLDEMRQKREESHRRTTAGGTAGARPRGSPAASQTARTGASTWTSRMEEQLDALAMMTKVGRASRAAGDEEAVRQHREKLRQQLQKLLVPRGGGGRGRRLGGVEDDDAPAAATLEAPVRQWRSIAIKFPNRRVNERWFNLLQGTAQTLQWQYYLNHLPHMDVLNLLLARLFFENNSTDSLHDLIRDKLQKNLSNVSNNFGDNLKGDIRIDGLTIGGEVPLITNVSDCVVDQTGELDFDFDVLYRGGLMMTIRLANFSYRDIHVPDLLFHIKVLELSGRLHFNVGPPPTQKFWLGCRRVPDLRLEFTQEVASHEGILNVVLNILPDMSNPMTNVVKTLLFDDMVYPSFDDFPWPVVDGPEKKKASKAAKAAKAAQAAKEEQDALSNSQRSNTSQSARKSKKSKNATSVSPSTGGAADDAASPSVGNGSLASTVLSGGGPAGAAAAGGGGGDRSPPPRPVSSRPPCAPATPKPPPQEANSTSRAVVLSSDADSGAATPVLLSARNLDDDDDDPKGRRRVNNNNNKSDEDSEVMNSARRRRVGTVIRVSAPIPGRGAVVSSSSDLADARAEAARTFSADTPIEYLSSGQSAVSATARTPGQTPTLSSTRSSKLLSPQSSGARTRITVSTPDVPHDGSHRRTGADKAVVFSGGSSGSIASSTRASRTAKS